MILASRNADVLMYNGLDLEIGYLPLLIESSRNPEFNRDSRETSTAHALSMSFEKQPTADRSMGDVHPLGNPHYHYSPSNILRVARGMAQELSNVDPANSSFYRTNLASFEERLRSKQIQWGKKSPKGKRFVSYHKLFEYMANEFGFQLIGYIEPKPGIPPSAGHIESLIESMKKVRPDGILVTPSYGLDEAKSLSKKTGVRVIIIPQDVGAVPGADDWFSFMDIVLSSLQ